MTGNKNGVDLPKKPLTQKGGKAYTMKTITVTFPEVKIKVGIEKMSFDTLENMIHEIGDQIKELVMERTLRDIDDELRINRQKGELENKGKRAKYFLVCFGNIRYKRTRYRDTKTGKARYLLDEALGIKENQRISLKRAQIETYLASLSPYRKVVKQTELIGGYRRSHESIRQSVIKEAERIIAHQEKELEKIRNLDYEEEAEPQETVYVESDSTFIKLQKRHKGKKRRKGKKTIDVKIGIGYTDKEPRYRWGRQKSKKLKDKFVFTGVSSSGRQFMEKLSLITEKKLSLSRVKKVFFGGDGSSWITRGIKDYFPQATYLLCLFHLYRNIKEALASRKEEQKIIKKLLMHNKIDQALRRIKDMFKQVRDKKEKEYLNNLYTYILNNRQGITNVITIKDKRMKRAGAIEPNIDKLVAHRMKKRGMSWSIKGALGILKMQEIILNGEWQDWWQRQRDEKIEINYIPPPLSAAQVLKDKAVSPFIEAQIPSLRGPDQDKPWVGVLKELTRASYFSQ